MHRTFSCVALIREQHVHRNRASTWRGAGRTAEHDESVGCFVCEIFGLNRRHGVEIREIEVLQDSGCSLLDGLQIVWTYNARAKPWRSALDAVGVVVLRAKLRHSVFVDAHVTRNTEYALVAVTQLVGRYCATLAFESSRIHESRSMRQLEACTAQRVEPVRKCQRGPEDAHRLFDITHRFGQRGKIDTAGAVREKPAV